MGSSVIFYLAAGGNHEESDDDKAKLNLSRRDKIWVAAAIIALAVGFILAVLFDL